MKEGERKSGAKEVLREGQVKQARRRDQRVLVKALGVPGAPPMGGDYISRRQGSGSTCEERALGKEEPRMCGKVAEIPVGVLGMKNTASGTSSRSCPYNPLGPRGFFLGSGYRSCPDDPKQASLVQVSHLPRGGVERQLA